jgi:hypothetical protein
VLVPPKPVVLRTVTRASGTVHDTLVSPIHFVGLCYHPLIVAIRLGVLLPPGAFQDSLPRAGMPSSQVSQGFLEVPDTLRPLVLLAGTVLPQALI